MPTVLAYSGEEETAQQQPGRDRPMPRVFSPDGSEPAPLAGFIRSTDPGQLRRGPPSAAGYADSLAGGGSQAGDGGGGSGAWQLRSSGGATAAGVVSTDDEGWTDDGAPDHHLDPPREAAIQGDFDPMVVHGRGTRGVPGRWGSGSGGGRAGTPPMIVSSSPDEMQQHQQQLPARSPLRPARQQQERRAQQAGGSGSDWSAASAPRQQQQQAGPTGYPAARRAAGPAARPASNGGAGGRAHGSGDGGGTAGGASKSGQRDASSPGRCAAGLRTIAESPDEGGMQGARAAAGAPAPGRWQQQSYEAEEDEGDYQDDGDDGPFDDDDGGAFLGEPGGYESAGEEQLQAAPAGADYVRLLDARQSAAEAAAAAVEAAEALDQATDQLQLAAAADADARAALDLAEDAERASLSGSSGTQRQQAVRAGARAPARAPPAPPPPLPARSAAPPPLRQLQKRASQTRGRRAGSPSADVYSSGLSVSAPVPAQPTAAALALASAAAARARRLAAEAEAAHFRLSVATGHASRPGSAAGSAAAAEAGGAQHRPSSRTGTGSGAKRWQHQVSFAGADEDGGWPTSGRQHAAGRLQSQQHAAHALGGEEELDAARLTLSDTRAIAEALAQQLHQLEASRQQQAAAAQGSSSAGLSPAAQNLGSARQQVPQPQQSQPAAQQPPPAGSRTAQSVGPTTHQTAAAPAACSHSWPVPGCWSCAAAAAQAGWAPLFWGPPLPGGPAAGDLGSPLSPGAQMREAWQQWRAAASASGSGNGAAKFAPLGAGGYSPQWTRNSMAGLYSSSASEPADSRPQEGYIIPSILRAVTYSPEGNELKRRLDGAAITHHQRCLRMMDWAFEVYRQMPTSSLRVSLGRIDRSKHCVYIVCFQGGACCCIASCNHPAAISNLVYCRTRTDRRRQSGPGSTPAPPRASPTRSPSGLPSSAPTPGSSCSSPWRPSSGRRRPRRQLASGTKTRGRVAGEATRLTRLSSSNTIASSSSTSTSSKVGPHHFTQRVADRPPRCTAQHPPRPAASSQPGVELQRAHRRRQLRRRRRVHLGPRHWNSVLTCQTGCLDWP